MSKKIKIITSPSGIGAGTLGAEKGPLALFSAAKSIGFKKFSNLGSIEIITDRKHDTIENNFQWAHNIGTLSTYLPKVASVVKETIAEGTFPLIISGDHSNAIGSVMGYADFYQNNNPALIWIDAHLDLHSPYTTPSGNIHGMSVNALIEDDNRDSAKNAIPNNIATLWDNLKRAGGPSRKSHIKPENIVFIGVRDFEKEEIQLAEKHNIKIYTADDVHKIGIFTILESTLQYLNNCDTFYISFDVDSLDPSISKGTGTPVPNGLSIEQAEVVFKTFFHHHKTAAFEITEINPDLDEDNKMAKAMAGLLKTVL